MNGHVVLDRTDILTTDPSDINYRLVINSWTQVNPEINIKWAGQFKHPSDGRVPQSRFRNIRYSQLLPLYNNNTWIMVAEVWKPRLRGHADTSSAFILYHQLLSDTTGKNVLCLYL